MRESLFISPEDPRWTDALNRVAHDVYHLPQYASHYATFMGGEPCSYYWRSGDQVALAPLIVNRCPSWLGEKGSRRGGGPWRDASSPYGYAGPITNAPGRCESEVLHDMVCQARESGILTLFLRSHPLLSTTFQSIEGDNSSQLGTTYSIPLPDSVPTEENASAVLLNQYRGSYKRSIRKLLADCPIEFRFGEWEMVPHFGELYRRNMERLDAHSSYFFDDAYFFNLHSSLLDAAQLLTAYSDGQFIAGVVFFACDGLMQYHLPACADEWRAKGLPKALVHQCAVWGATRGYREFHLGGGVGSSSDSLAYFKEGFGSKSYPFRVYRLVADNEAYSSIADLSEEFSESFFPSYRHPRYRYQQNLSLASM